MSSLNLQKFAILIPTLFLAAAPIFAQADPAFAGQPSGPDAAEADAAPDPQAPGVARISLLNGDVSVRRGEAGENVAAALNAPVMSQDILQTGQGARAEIQFDYASMLRLAQNCEVRFAELQNGHFQMQIGRGTVTFRILRESGAQIEVDTPSVSIRPAHPGVYRITVTDDGLSYITPRGGQLEVFTPKGTQIINTGQTLMARGQAADPEYRLAQPIPRDDWDNWSDVRDRQFEQAMSSNAPYVPQDVYGTEELQGRGNWSTAPEYGAVWTPTVGADWSPYSNGRWVWSDYYGWTWVSYDPWGWAPYHYGRWFFRTGFGWSWWPGALHGRHYWAPAYVGFFGFGGVGGGFGRIGWVALAPHEHFNRWYGPGWYGRDRFSSVNVRVVNNVNIASTYRNARFGNAVMAMNASQFGRTGSGYSRVSSNELRSASAIHGALPVAGSAQSMRFSDRNASTVGRTNFNQTRFASHPMSTNQIGRVGSMSGSGQQFGRGTGSSTSTPRGLTSGTPGSSGSWNRFGQTGSAPSTSQTYRTAPSPSTGGNSGNSWNRFGATNGTPQQPRSTGNAPRPSYSQPQYQGRGSSPAYSAPQSQAPRYSAPSTPTPRYSAPSAPAQRSAPAPSGGRPSGGSAPSHSSSSGGSHGGSTHRR